MKKRILALFLVAAMAVGMFPTALAVRDERPEVPEDLVSQAIAGDVPTDGDAQTTPVVPTVAEEIPAELAAADAEAATYDYGGEVTATALSYQAASGANSPEAALDNNTGTWWHTAWNGNSGGTDSLTDLTNDPDKRYIQLNLTETIQLDGLRYLSRSADPDNHDYGNGVVTQYRIEVSTDGASFTSVAAGSWEPGDAAWRVAVFPEAVQAQYVRLYGVRTYGNGEGLTGDAHTTKDVNKYMSAAELRLLTGVPNDWRPTNLARLEGVTAETSQNEINNSTTDADGKALDGAAAIDGIKSNVNNVTKPSGHWSTPQNPTKPATLTVDLHRMCSIDMVKLFWKHDAVTAYTVQGSSDGTDWTDIGSKSSRVSAATVGELVAPTEAAENIRYLKLSVTDYDNQGTAGWANVNLWEIEIYGTAGELIVDGTPSRNLCRPTDGVSVTATAKSVESGTSFTADKVIDGDATTKPSRWSSANNTEEQWLQIDLGAVRTVSLVKLFWERTNVTAYTLQVSRDNTNWKTVYTCSSRITQTAETISFTSTAARYIKINVTGHDDQGATSYRNIALYEVEVYRDANAIPQAASTVLETITSQNTVFAIQGGKLILHPDIDLPEDFTVTFAANLEQVVGADHTVYTPVVDKHVEIDLTVTDDADPANTASTPANSPISITIPGQHATADNTGNHKPAVIPEIMEWYSSAEQSGEKFTLTENSRIVAPAELNTVANEVKADVQDLFGLELSVVSGTAGAGDVALALGSGAQVAGFDDETYRMEVTDRVIITAKAAQGAYWGTRTLLQGLKLSGEERSFPNGTLRDYPEFKVRGFMLDVGRKPQSMDTLYNIVKNMAWYKLNDFHLHLNDDLIFMEDYCEESDRSDYQSAYEAYSAFRLESNIQEEAGAKPLTAKDYAYTKAEFKQFVQNSRALGVEIVPEIDVPAHAKALTDAFPSLRLNKSGTFSGTTRPWIDHLDLTNKMNESVAKANEIFNEYIDEGVFDNIVHFGADEYYDTYSAYAPFAKAMVDNIQSKGRTVRMWGSLSTMGDSNHLFTKEVAQNIQMNIWSTGWANPTAMYNLGFSLINITDVPFYMVPNGGGGRSGYGDYLNLTDVYNKAPNQIGNTWFPASSSQILGESFAIWMDNIDTRASGLDEVDTFVRFFDTLPVVAVRQWGVENNTPARTLTELQADAAIIGTAPQTDSYYYQADDTGFFTYDFTDATDKSGNGHDLTLTNAEINSSKSVLILNGGASYAETGLDRLGWGNQLSFRALKLTGGGEEQILFEGDHAYGDFSIKALPVEGDDTQWKLGFSRELYDYEFDVELPVGQWVKLTLTNEPQSTKLSVDGGAPVAAVGKFVSKPDSNTQFRGRTGITNSSFELPVARIGSKTNAFKGYIAAVSTGESIDIPFMTASSPSFNSDGIPFNAIDGDTSTIYHSNYTESAIPTNGPLFKDLPAEQRYIQLDLTTPVTLSGLKHLRRQSGNNGYITSYDIRVSTDGKTYTSVKTGSGWSASNDWDTATFTPQSGVVSVRLYRTDTSGDFMSVAELELIYEPIDLAAANATVTVGDVTWGETEATAEITVALESGFLLTEGTDYTVTYSKNTAAGTATATITGTGGYTGTVTATFAVPAKPVVVDFSSATVTFGMTSYPLENGKAEPEPVVKIGEATLLRGLDYTVTYANNTAIGTATVVVDGMGVYVGSVVATFTISNGGGVPTPPPPSNTSGGTVSSLVTVEDLADGSTVTTSVDPLTGTASSATRYPDGTKVESETTVRGETTATVTLAEKSKPTTVIIPTTEAPALGQVAVVINPDGTQEILKSSLPTEDGLAITVSEDVRVKIVDNTKEFVDVSENHWAKDAITYVTSREIFNGTGSGTFTPNGAMSRAMVCTVLANLEGVDTSGGQTWYEKAVDWAKDQKVSDGSNPNTIVSREQLVTMLYRYAGSPATTGGLKGFTDAGKVSNWAAIPMAWAIEQGLIAGRGNGQLDPATSASRAEVALIFQRYLSRK